MSDENKIRDAADAAKGILEAVPIYPDMLQPAAKEMGKSLLTITKALNIALAPLAIVVWGYGQISDYLNRTLAEKLKNVPPEQIVPPKMTIAGPIVEQMRFTADEPSLRELYANLLATSMDAQTAREAHPAFVEIIRQLSPDEARLLELLSKQEEDFFELVSVNVIAMFPKDETMEQKVYSFDSYDELPIACGCTDPDLILSYIDNLCRLGLWQVQRSELEKFETSILHENFKDEAIRKVSDDIKQTAGRECYVRDCLMSTDIIRFTSLGLQFCNACIYEFKPAPQA